MIGYWTYFPYWLSVLIIGLGGILGVMYSVPLRRALVTGSDLPYPEGVAAAEVLKVGAGVGGAEENRRVLVAIITASLSSAAFFTLAKARLLADAAGTTFRVGSGASGASVSLSMALTFAHSEGRERFDYEDIFEAMTTIESGTAINIEYGTHETKAVAIHEAGHAAASHAHP